MNKIDIVTLSDDVYSVEPGLWKAQKQSSVSYPENVSNMLDAIEPRSFWFRHRNRCIISACASFLDAHSGFIDIGGGNGFVAAGLQQAGYNTILLEPGTHSARNALRKGIPNVINSTFDNVRFHTDSLPSAGLFDVIEHIEDDVEFLRNMYSVQQSGSYLVVTVPAYMALWSHEDEISGHYRRYTVKQLRTALCKAGYSILHSTYIFSSVIALTYASKLVCTRKDTLEKQQLEKMHLVHYPMIQNVIEYSLAHEPFLIAKKWKIPCGGSCLVVAQKQL